MHVLAGTIRKTRLLKEDLFLKKENSGMKRQTVANSKYMYSVQNFKLVLLKL